MNEIKACIFDLDGVIVDTAKYHYKAWKRLANELGFDFSEDDNEKLKGVSRTESLELILQWGKLQFNDEQKAELADRKNAWYVDYISQMTPAEILPGVLPFLDSLVKRNIKLVLGSASKNATPIIQSVGLKDYFMAIIDGNSTTISKPDPEVFLLCAAAADVHPRNAIVFEDAYKGVEAALNGGFYTVGVGNVEVLTNAHMVIPSFEYIDFPEILEALGMSVGKI